MEICSVNYRIRYYLISYRRLNDQRRVLNFVVAPVSAKQSASNSIPLDILAFGIWLVYRSMPSIAVGKEIGDRLMVKST